MADNVNINGIYFAGIASALAKICTGSCLSSWLFITTNSTDEN
jgi:hypothetical protein